MVGPMAHRAPLQTGKSMETGMGMMKGHALSEENAPGFGRGMGMTRAEQPTTPMVGPSPHAQHDGRNGKGRAPGFPQDMWMPMDEEVAKPETQGLPEGWSGALGGMMTLVRVLPPEKYDEIMVLVKQPGSAAQPARPPSAPAAPAPSAPGGGHRH
jgi:hypothetical protein